MTAGVVIHESWKRPVPQRIAKVWTDALEAADHDKAYAHDTPFRFSGAMGCSRALGYEAAGVERSNPMDGPSLAITGMGSLLHEDIQDANLALFPDMAAESTGQLLDLLSGHIDLDDLDDDAAVEVKTVGAYKFDLSIGIMRSPGRGQPAKRTTPQGPSLNHICQGGFNARSHGRAMVRIVYISREAVATKKARQLEMESLDRFTAEWLIGPEVWGPLVDAEIARLEGIRRLVNGGEIPDRIDIDENRGRVTAIKVDIETHWRCDGYCQWQDQCREDGPGRVRIAVPKLRVAAS